MRVRGFRPSRGVPLSTSCRVRGCPQRFVAPARSARSCSRVRENGWWLCCPCPACGGVELPLQGRPNATDLARGRLHLEPAIDGNACPGCETRRNRSTVASGRTRPCVWYDTVLRDWVVQLAWTGPGGGAILPLEIRWFDASLASVYRAAGDLAFSGDAFEQSHGD